MSLRQLIWSTIVGVCNRSPSCSQIHGPSIFVDEPVLSGPDALDRIRLQSTSHRNT